MTRYSWGIRSLLIGSVVWGCGTEPPDPPPARHCEIETADEQALAVLAGWGDLPTFREGRYVHVTSADRETRVFPSVAVGNRDFNNYLCAGSVTGTGGPDLYLDAPTCPEPYVKGYMAARLEGAGRLARLWATGIDLPSGNLSKDAILRIYVDDDPTPCIELSFGEAKTPPPSLEMFAAPFGANTDNNLAWYYPVVFSNKLVVAIDNVPDNQIWYQVDAVLDTAPTEHAASAERLPARDAAEAVLRQQALAPPDLTPLLSDRPVSLPNNVPVTVAALTGPATLRSFRVRVPDDELAALNLIDVTATWDGTMSPAISLPLGDLYASASGMADSSSSSLPLAITKANGETTLDLRLPMPFASTAVIGLVNRGADAIVNLAIDGVATLPAEPWGVLTVTRSETLGPTNSSLHPVVTAFGVGRLVGVCQMARGQSSQLIDGFRDPLNFLEGDEHLTVDGNMFHGTGTEDYFDSALYFNPASAATPFAQWGGKIDDDVNDVGQMTACRWHILGAAIDFHQSLDLSIEAGPPDPATLVRYVTTAFVYRGRAE